MTESNSSPSSEPQLASQVPGFVPPNSTEESDKKDSDTTTVSITYSNPIHAALQREANRYGFLKVSEFLRALAGFAARLPGGVNLKLTLEEGNQPELPLGA